MVTEQCRRSAPGGDTAEMGQDPAGGGATATPREPALTLKARRLAGSAACRNCGTPLRGPFCFYCGQPDRKLIRFFPVLLSYALRDTLELDSRFMRTMRPLLFHPGRLTRDYLEGKRFRYTPPLRLYIFSSMIFFILAATLAGSIADIRSLGDSGGLSVQLGTDDWVGLEAGLREAVREGALSPQQADRIKRLAQSTTDPAALSTAEATLPTVESAVPHAPAPEQPAAGTATNEEVADGFISLNGKPWDRATNPVIIPFLPALVNGWINDEIGQSPRKRNLIEQNPDLLIDQLFEILPLAVFLMLPLVALLFKFWYLFAGRYYVEHLIHALHNHAFLFVVFILMLATNSLAGWLASPDTEVMVQALKWVNVALWGWVPLYLLISLKTVYRQGWTMTLTKFSLVGVSYLALLALVTGVVAVLGFLLL